MMELPWLQAPLREAIEGQRGHAILVHAAEGSGALAFTLSLAQAWLCESEAGARPCGRCGSCRLIQSRVHPDLIVLLPEVLRRQHGWPLTIDKPEGDDSRRKPSRQIRIDEVRLLIDWATRSSGRGRGKLAVLHPAEALNLQSANALLKTLEEPTPGTRILLSCAEPEWLLPTVRSRCQRFRLPDPPADQACAWLKAQAVEQPEVLLAACAGRPLDALALAKGGVDAQAWSALASLVARGRPGALAGWPLDRALDALQKLCHDALAMACGAAPRYFPAAAMPPAGAANPLRAWSEELQRVARHADHPWNEGLLLEGLVQSGAKAWKPGSATPDASQVALDTLR